MRRGLESDDACVEFVIIAFETFDVFGIVVGRAVLPAAPQDALPFEGQGAEGGLAVFAALELPLVIAAGPDTKGEGRARHFVEGLAEELGTGPTHVNPHAATAGLFDRRNARSEERRVGKECRS